MCHRIIQLLLLLVWQSGIVCHSAANMCRCLLPACFASGTTDNDCFPPSHLSAGGRPGPNANGGHTQGLGDGRCNGPRDAFQHNGEASRLLQRLGLVQHTQRAASHLRLRPEATWGGGGTW